MERHVIYGPPGTGKSTEIVARVNQYLKKYKPYEIGLCSYTKAAAEVLAERCNIKSKWIGTIHSIAFKLAGCIYEQTINYHKLKEFEKLSGIPFTGGNPDEADQELSNGDYYLALYGLHKAILGKDYMETYDNSDRPGLRDEFKFFVDAYNQWKKSTGYIDFNDMLIMALQAENPPVQVLFIDEAQDLSPLQWTLIDKWSKTVPIMYVAGDDDQAIYEWAGADPQGMFEFEKRHNAKRVILDQSYRVPELVHKKAQEIITNITDRVNKPYKARQAKGDIEYYSGIETVLDLKADDDVLILYRNHSLREMVEDYLISKGFPYVTDNGRPGMCQGWYWKLLTLYKRIQSVGADKYTMKVNEHKLLLQGLHEHLRMKLGTPEVTEAFKLRWQEALNIKPDVRFYFEQIEDQHPDFKVKPNIHLSTIHGSKGREAKRVILINGMGAMSAQKFYGGDISSEARVFYVAVTRAKERLDIVQADNSIGWL
jgi:DNA helicase-2/ATP-dependent DNA helicase PcrA